MEHKFLVIKISLHCHKINDSLYRVIKYLHNLNHSSNAQTKIHRTCYVVYVYTSLVLTNVH